MLSSNKQKLIDAIEVLNKLGIENEDIMILGSIALDICGMFPKSRSDAHDVDVMVRLSKQREGELLNIIKLWNSVTPDDEKNKQGSESSTVVMNIKDKNLILNFWFIETGCKFPTPLKLDNGVWVERPIDCINKKKSYGRIKDYQDIRQIVTQIL